MANFAPDTGLAVFVTPSPNHGERRGRDGLARAPDMLILHYTGLKTDALEAWTAAPGREALAWLCDPQSQVSSHYLVETDGKIHQLVPEARRAWHAGAGGWKGETDINSAAIGIEIVNTGHDGGLPPYPQAQIAAVIALCRDICMRHGIAPERVLAHSDVAPGRKADPGEHFPWAQLFEAGIGHWVVPRPTELPGPALGPGDAGPEVRDLRATLAAYGYALPVTEQYDALAEAVVCAFQRHFRPQKCHGIADAGTRATLHELVQSLAGKHS